MPWSALPPHINEPHEWDGHDDDDHWYTKWKKQVKGWFAFGPRAKEKWARFREYPALLFAVGDMGAWRFEDNEGSFIEEPCTPLILFTPWDGFYLSRVQYGKYWHIGLQWPLFLHGHFGKWQFYVGFKRDADRAYWAALYFGRKWK